MLKELKTQHREIARLRVQGLSPADISVRTETNLQTVYNILRDPLCKGYMNGLSDQADETIIDVRKRLAKMNIAALKVMEDILDPRTENVPYSVQANVAKDTLDRTGYKAPERIEKVEVHLTGEDIKELKERQQALLQEIVKPADATVQ